MNFWCMCDLHKSLKPFGMMEVYTLLNAVQYEITANRFEALAAEMSKLRPEQDI